MDKTLEQCYETLGLSIDATKEDVRKAYKRLALKCHPDKNQNSPEANRKFQELGFAYKRITEDEELEEINEDCSEYDYWMEVFYYCLLKENIRVRYRNRGHCCPNCGQNTEEDDAFLESLYEKHKRKGRDVAFTDEEMKNFAKFNSLEEQREFNKKTFCDSKKSSKQKNEPKVRKVKAKTNNQLKAEQWKREKEMTKIAEELKIKNKQQEQKIKHAKECQERKREKEKLERSKNGPEMEEQKNGNGQQCEKRKKEQPKKKNTGAGKNMPAKQKPKKTHKKGRAKTEDDKYQKVKQQEHKTCKSTPPEIKPAINSHVLKRDHHSKPAAPVTRPSKPVEQPTKPPTPIQVVQPPNIWMKRLETQNEIREIQPMNEEEELRQLEIALEMSKKQVEIEQQQKEIAALQEEIRLMSLEQEKLQACEQSSEIELEDTCEADPFLADCEASAAVLSCAESDDDHHPNLVLNNLQAVGNEQGNNACDSDDSDNDECDCTCTYEMESTVGAFHKPQNQFFRPWKNSKVQTKACASRVKEWKPCPYGKNCCLGKKCKYSHSLVQGGGGADHQNACDEKKENENHDSEDKKIIDEVNHVEMPTSGQDDMLVTEDWDDEIESTNPLSCASNVLLCSSSSSSVPENESSQKGPQSVASKDGGKGSFSCTEKGYEKKPVVYLQYDVTNEISAPEDWECEIEDNTVDDPPQTGNTFSQAKYPTLLRERPKEGTVHSYKEDNHVSNGATKVYNSSTGHEETVTDWEEECHTPNTGSMNNVQHEGDESTVEDAVKMGLNAVGKQSSRSPQQDFVDNPTLPIPCHQSISPGMCPVMTDSAQCPQTQYKTNPSQLGSQHCQPFPGVGMPGMFPAGVVMRQPGLCNVSQMPSLFIPQPNNYSEVNPAASSALPKTASGYYPGVPSQNSCASVSATSESGTQKATYSSAKQAPNFVMPNFPTLPNMYFGFPGNIGPICAGVLPNMTGVPNIQPNPMMTVPVIPGFLPPMPHQPLPNNLINMPSAVSTDSINHLQKMTKLPAGPVSANYQSSSSLNPSKGSSDEPNPIPSYPLIALESNYHAILEMQMNGAPAQTDVSCVKEHYSDTLDASQDSGTTPGGSGQHAFSFSSTKRNGETGTGMGVQKLLEGQIGKISDISESEYKKEDKFKMNDLRKPSSVPKALSYAERHH